MFLLKIFIQSADNTAQGWSIILTLQHEMVPGLFFLKRHIFFDNVKKEAITQTSKYSP